MYLYLQNLLSIVFHQFQPDKFQNFGLSRYNLFTKSTFNSISPIST
jgi:hypothetical protein